MIDDNDKDDDDDEAGRWSTLRTGPGLGTRRRMIGPSKSPTPAPP
jgi:hypothetical protein